MYVIVTKYSYRNIRTGRERTIRHVYANPAWTTRARASTAAKRMRQEDARDLPYYTDRETTEHDIAVVELIETGASNGES